MDLVLMFGLGAEFMMMGADLVVHVAAYNNEDRTRDDVSPKFVQVIRQPLDFNQLAKNKFHSRKVASIKLSPDQINGQFLAFKMTIQANVDNNQGIVPLITDFYIEGFCLLPHNKLVRQDPACNCNIF